MLTTRRSNVTLNVTILFQSTYVWHADFTNISSANFAFQVDWMYYVAFGAVVVGLIIYSGYVISRFVRINLLSFNAGSLHCSSHSPVRKFSSRVEWGAYCILISLIYEVVAELIAVVKQMRMKTLFILLKMRTKDNMMKKLILQVNHSNSTWAGCSKKLSTP